MEEIQETGELPAAALMARPVNVENKMAHREHYSRFERLSHGRTKQPVGELRRVDGE
jgi:hypothetical protein